MFQSPTPALRSATGGTTPPWPWATRGSSSCLSLTSSTPSTGRSTSPGTPRVRWRDTCWTLTLLLCRNFLSAAGHLPPAETYGILPHSGEHNTRARGHCCIVDLAGLRPLHPHCCPQLGGILVKQRSHF